jgi:hypothetical protein
MDTRRPEPIESRTLGNRADCAVCRDSGTDRWRWEAHVPVDSRCPRRQPVITPCRKPVNNQELRAWKIRSAPVGTAVRVRFEHRSALVGSRKIRCDPRREIPGAGSAVLCIARTVKLAQIGQSARRSCRHHHFATSPRVNALLQQPFGPPHGCYLKCAWSDSKKSLSDLPPAVLPHDGDLRRELFSAGHGGSAAAMRPNRDGAVRDDGSATAVWEWTSVRSQTAVEGFVEGAVPLAGSGCELLVHRETQRLRHALIEDPSQQRVGKADIGVEFT